MSALFSRPLQNDIGEMSTVDGQIAALPDSLLRECVVAATTAPSVHNTQPWLFRLRVEGLDVFVDRRRQLPTLDPDGREMYISVGAALFTLRLALRARGYRTRVSRTNLHDDLVARVRIAGPAETTPGVRALAAAITQRRTNRRPFHSTPVPDRILDEVSAAAAAERVTMLVTDGPTRSGILSMTRTANNRMQRNPVYLKELAAWTTTGGVGRRDGVPRGAFGPRATNAALPLRDLGLGLASPTATVDFEPDPTIALLYTAGDTQTQWIHTWQALQRLWLTATVRGVAITPLSQLTEIPALRDLVADRDSDRVVQMTLRIGYPTSHVAATPRRSPEEVILPTQDA
jgi:nitroreductase